MLIFQNPGLIEMAAVTTMGVSVKEGDSPIGFFGTGLKFAIATVLRNGGSMVIWRGLEAFHFAAEREQVRGQDFEFVTMNGQRIGFTTQLGRTWEPWMAFRELASNCRDECGRYWLEKGLQTDDPAEGQTTIVVLCPALDEVWPERGTILLEGEPLWTGETGEAYEGASAFAYYRGVRIYKLPRPSAFTYNVTGAKLDLSEDRQAANWWQLELQLEKIIGQCADEALLRRVLTVGEHGLEHHLNVDRFGQPGPEFRAAARELALGSEAVPNLNPAAREAARSSALADMTPGDAIRLEPVRQAMLDKAPRLLLAAGFDVLEFPVIVTNTLGAGIAGLAMDGKVFLSLLPFEKGTREVAATLLEEFAHLRSGAEDCTRPFQNWLIDQLLVATERAAGEAF